MLAYPHIDPILLTIGPLQIRWYGLMYLLGFSATYMLVKYQLRTLAFKSLQEQFENLNIILILSVIIGGRLGYVLFYNLPYFLKHPLEIPATWTGGMSFHGAVIGLLIGSLLFCRRKQINFFSAADLYVVTIPIGLGLGRVGNFINGELFGRPSALPWAIVFPGGGPIARHPSQLYEALLEGVLLFVLLWSLRKKPWQRTGMWPHGSLMALFFICYGCLRFVVEFFREPDPQLGHVIAFMTMGQVLSTIMVIGGGFLGIWLLRTRSRKQPTGA